MNYVFAAIIIPSNVIIIHNSLNELDISVPLGFHIFCTV